MIYPPAVLEKRTTTNGSSMVNADSRSAVWPLDKAPPPRRLVTRFRGLLISCLESLSQTHLIHSVVGLSSGLPTWIW